MPQEIEMPAAAAARRATASSVGNRRKKRRLVPVVLVLAALLTSLIVPPVMAQYDKTHRATIECTVTDAKGIDHGRRRGGPVSRVVISTSECGTVFLSEGVTSENRGAKAAEVVVGGRYAFNIGQSERMFLGLTKHFLSLEARSAQQID